MNKALLTICLTAFTLQGFGQDNSAIDRQDLRAFVRVLASDSFEGRETGTEGARRAANFIALRFSTLGLEPWNADGYQEKFTLHQSYWGEVYLKTAGNVLHNFESMVLQGTHAENKEVEKEVVFGGSGTEQELSRISVRDRLVLVFVNNLRSHYDINKRLAKKGAHSVIIANPANDKQFSTIVNTFKDYTLKKRLSLPDDTVSTRSAWDSVRLVNTITIDNSEIKNIMHLSVRELSKLIRAGRIEKVPVSKVKIKLEWIKNILEPSNVVGTLKGKSDTTIVISAHYDHLGKSEKEYFPGADDNASGTAALLEIAQELSGMKERKYTVMFLATSGEEEGLLGSVCHVEGRSFNASKILCDINLDMLGRSDDKHRNAAYIYFIGTGQSALIDSAIRKADAAYDKCAIDFSLDNTKEPLGLFTRSDNYSFYNKGIPAVQFFTGLHIDYHKPTDTADKIDFVNLENRIRLISLVIAILQGKEPTGND